MNVAALEGRERGKCPSCAGGGDAWDGDPEHPPTICRACGGTGKAPHARGRGSRGRPFLEQLGHARHVIEDHRQRRMWSSSADRNPLEDIRAAFSGTRMPAPSACACDLCLSALPVLVEAKCREAIPIWFQLPEGQRFTAVYIGLRDSLEVLAYSPTDAERALARFAALLRTPRRKPAQCRPAP